MKNKILYIFSLILFAMILLFQTKVNAAEYSNNDKSVVVTMDDLGLGGNKKIEFKGLTNAFEGEYIYNTITIENVKQSVLNDYAKEPKTVKAKAKLKLPKDITKVILAKNSYNYTQGEYTHGDRELKIETINGSKYITYDFDLVYNNISGEQPLDSNICSITLHSPELMHSPDTVLTLYKANGTSIENRVSTLVSIVSENKPFDYSFCYENKYGQDYPTIGGSGGGDEDTDKWYLTTKSDINGRYEALYALPTNVKLSDTYCALYINVYQGNKIEVEGMGTLNYAGATKTNVWGQKGVYYVYKNSLDKLKKIDKPVTFKAKTENGYTLTRGISFWWQLSEKIGEEKIKVENTDMVLNKIYGEYDNLKVGTIKARKTDTIYKKLENGYDDIKDTSNDRISININDLCVASGIYKGNINIEFNVGTENNGKEYIVDYGYYINEDFEIAVYNGTIKDGKVTITIDSSILPRKDNNIIKPGDLNGDGKINTKDAREVLLAYIGKTKLTEEQRVAADVNRDGKINTKDARQILLYYIGKIKNF